jgi:hypothetical protein
MEELMRRFSALACIALAVMASAVRAEERTARDGMAFAMSAADAWADDARLVWVENDAPLDTEGRAGGWGYLFYSREKHAMRSWSVRDGRITTAVDQPVSAEAPAVDPAWKDSGEIAALAWSGGGREFCATRGTLIHLVLVRGVFAAESAWCAVFDNGNGPDLYVLLDAKSGDVKKRWRG